MCCLQNVFSHKITCKPGSHREEDTFMTPSLVSPMFLPLKRLPVPQHRLQGRPDSLGRAPRAQRLRPRPLESELPLRDSGLSPDGAVGRGAPLSPRPPGVTFPSHPKSRPDCPLPPHAPEPCLPSQTPRKPLPPRTLCGACGPHKSQCSRRFLGRDPGGILVGTEVDPSLCSTCQVLPMQPCRPPSFTDPGQSGRGRSESRL